MTKLELEQTNAKLAAENAELRKTLGDLKMQLTMRGKVANFKEHSATAIRNACLALAAKFPERKSFTSTEVNEVIEQL